MSDRFPHLNRVPGYMFHRPTHEFQAGNGFCGSGFILTSPVITEQCRDESRPTKFSSTTVILAGGRGTRMGGGKGLQQLRGRALIAWVLDAVRQQSDELLISANEDRAAYAVFGCAVIADTMPGWHGPLAGLQSALGCAYHDVVACVPCDTPFLPGDLIDRLLAAMNRDAADAAVAVVAGRRQPTIAVYRKRVLVSLDAFLAAGGHKVGEWLDTLRLNEVVFDDVAAFININTSEELAEANQTCHDKFS